MNFVFILVAMSPSKGWTIALSIYKGMSLLQTGEFLKGSNPCCLKKKERHYHTQQKKEYIRGRESYVTYFLV